MASSDKNDVQGFLDRVGRHGPLLALDPGTKTIGVAISDVDRTLASPVQTIMRTKLAQDAEALRALCDQENVVGIVVGMPLNMDGSSGPRAQSVRAFTRSLEQHITLPYVFWDERLSTDAASQRLNEAGVSSRKRIAVIDAAAAAEILADFLRSNPNITNR